MRGDAYRSNQGRYPTSGGIPIGDGPAVLRQPLRREAFPGGQSSQSALTGCRRPIHRGQRDAAKRVHGPAEPPGEAPFSGSGRSTLKSRLGSFLGPYGAAPPPWKLEIGHSASESCQPLPGFSGDQVTQGFMNRAVFSSIPVYLRASRTKSSSRLSVVLICISIAD